MKELEESKKKMRWCILFAMIEIKKITKAKIHCNARGKKLSELIIEDILQETNTENVNLFVDEYNGENLDKEEAIRLNLLFDKKFQDATVVLVRQSMEKEPKVISKEKSVKVEKNMFELLEKTMTQADLDLGMRNPIQIPNLISVTQNVLEEEKTEHQYTLKKPALKDLAILKIEFAVSASIFKSKEIVEIASQVENQDQPSIRESEDTGKSSSDAKNQTQSAVTNFEPDEDFAIAQLPIASNDDETIIVYQYRYIESTKIGHSIISSDNPELFEVDLQDTGKGSFENLCALTCTFQKLNIVNSDSNNKPVILHFNTSTNEIPELFTAAFQHLEIKDKVTSNYQEFKVRKSILVCKFRVFRGLELQM